MKKTDAVILIHGLWMRGPVMGLLRYRLRRCGFITYSFSYPTRRCTVDEAAQRLRLFSEKIPERTVHYVAHSLGGVVVQRRFAQCAPQKPGRVIMLGTPHAGSSVARHLARFRLGRLSLGSSYAHGLAGELVTWGAQSELGVIAGDLSIGAGRLLGGLPRPNDGTVAVAETQIQGATAHHVLHTSHMGLLVSRQVARQVCAFLRDGVFI